MDDFEENTKYRCIVCNFVFEENEAFMDVWKHCPKCKYPYLNIELDPEEIKINQEKEKRILEEEKNNLEENIRIINEIKNQVKLKLHGNKDSNLSNEKEEEKTDSNYLPGVVPAIMLGVAAAKIINEDYKLNKNDQFFDNKATPQDTYSPIQHTNDIYDGWSTEDFIEGHGVASMLRSITRMIK